MKQNVVLKVLSLVLLLLAVLAVACAITVTGSGFLDLSNIFRALFWTISVICCIGAAVVWHLSRTAK